MGWGMDRNHCDTVMQWLSAVKLRTRYHVDSREILLWLTFIDSRSIIEVTGKRRPKTCNSWDNKRPRTYQT